MSIATRARCPVCLADVDVDGDGKIGPHLDANARRCLMSIHAAVAPIPVRVISGSARQEDLRHALLRRFKSAPPSTWSDKLLETVSNAIDLQFGEPRVEPAPRGRHLWVVPALDEGEPK